MIRKKETKITLVGAGPGDPELITVKGLKALKQADVVLYDALIHPQLLTEIPATTKTVFVGKRAGKHSSTQEEINQLMVQMAFAHGHVVRLKGGDPMVFGRGQEELWFARAFQIKTAIIPGLSSSTSVVGLQEVPLTSRGLSESFWVLTGTTKSGQLSKDINLAIQSSATVVILMGMRKLTEIMELFKEAGRADTPVMVVENGSYEEERVVLGSVADIGQKVKSAGLKTPGIITVGEVVRWHPEFQEVEKTKYVIQVKPNLVNHNR